MNWQAAGAGLGGTGSGAGGDLFTAVEGNVRELVSSAWWRTAAPQQRAEQVAARMLWGSSEWWLYGAWGRWYRCGLDGNWHPCPPPTTAADRAAVVPAPRGAGTPPVPPQLFPTGPDLAAGRVASLGFLGPVPETAVVARIQQALTTAWAVNPAQFAQQDPMFQPGTPSTVAAAWGALLWCAGSPVVLIEHPLIESFIPFLTTPAERLHWMMPPDFGTLAGYYINRLLAGDGGGAAHIARVMYEVAAGLQADARFRPGADALAAVTAASLRLIQQDIATARYGPAAVLQEWRRRCPAEYATPMVRDAAPGEYLRLALYDLQQQVAALTGVRTVTGGRPHDEVRRAGVAVLAADLQAAPGALPALQRWLDPDSARTLHTVLTDAAHPLRDLWPREGRLPDPLRTDDADALAALLATTYTVGLTWCRLAQVQPPATGFALPQAIAAELTGPAMHTPPSTDELSAWDIIKAAREHLASERDASGRDAQPSPPGAAPDQPVAPVPPPSPPGDAPGSPGEPQGAAAQPWAQLPPSPSGPPPGAPQGAPAPPPQGIPGAVPEGVPGAVPEGLPAAPEGAAGGAAAASPDAFAQPPRQAAAGAAVPPPPPPPPAPAWSADAPEGPQAGARPDPQAGWGVGSGTAPPWPADPSVTHMDPDPLDDVDPFSDDAPATRVERGGRHGRPQPGPPVPPGPGAVDGPSLPPPPAPVPEPPPPMPPPPDPGPSPQIVESYGIRFLCGADDIERVVTEVRRRGKWAKRLRGHEVSSASVPALLLIGAPSSGQRRVARMVARALAEVEVSSGEVHGMHADDLRDSGPDGLRAALDEHAGHVLLLQGLDTLILDHPQGAAFASALYRARLEGVSDTALLGTCEPERVGELSAASPELVTDLRAVRLPDLGDARLRHALLALLAEERRLTLDAGAWRVADRDLAVLHPIGRLTGARLVEAYLDRAATRRLGRAEATQAIGAAETLALTAGDFEGVAAELT
ncbi:hypothetical protein Acsp03_07550 [Actinomadura sp. NBRC 104412]|uniref:hypothetical protein n=1 Tax=Actinomadura sp. NBRC 104412 TaxID=3032203 RepID=UPI0024A1E633|nr:hypothetical protein [Actinomadura sp. NBRC 104412]GLZ03288.1 hypothetical protein Acsp03_07550 [Actinomadura sp. NBRC 104412]